MGGQMRRPDLMSDQWALLRFIVAFRGTVRSRTGEMIYTVARVFAKVSKPDVIPYYQNEVSTALALRKMIGELLTEAQMLARSGGAS